MTLDNEKTLGTPKSLEREKPLGEDERQELLCEYTSTQERINKARQKRETIQKMLETPGISAETKKNI